MLYLVTNNEKFSMGEKFSRTNLMYHNIQQVTVKESLEILNSHKVLGLDLETTGLDCHTDTITLLQLGTFLDQVVVDCTTVDIGWYKEIIENSTVLKLGANLKFDIQFLYAASIIPNNVYDVLLSEYVIYNGINAERLTKIYIKYCSTHKIPEKETKQFLRKAKNGWYSLFSLVYKYCDVVLDKEIRKDLSQILSKEVLQYAANDVKYLNIIYVEQMKTAEEAKCISAVRLENKFLRVLAYVEYCGLKLDKSRWLDLYNNNKDKHDYYIGELNKWIWDNNITKFKDNQLDMFGFGDYPTTINWNSSQQLINLLTGLGLDLRDKDGKVTTDDEVLSKYADHPLVALLLSFSEYKKKVSTYGVEFFKYIHKKTQRVHPDFTQLVNTSRLSCSKPNLTNIPADKDNTTKEESFRYCFVPEKGNVLCDADYSAQESIILINASQEKNLIKFYQDTPDADLHCYVAKLTFPEELKGLSLTEIKKQHKGLRQIAKVVEFATAYGGNAMTISNKTGVSKEDGERIYTQYMKAFPDLAAYFTKIGNLAKQNGYVTISPLTGRKFYFPFFEQYKKLLLIPDLTREEFRSMKIYEGTMQRIAQNYPIQGQSAETIKISAILIFDYIVQNRLFETFKLIDLVHDEVLAEFPEKYKEQFSKVIKDSMEKAGSYYCKTIPLKAEVACGDYWIH